MFFFVKSSLVYFSVLVVRCVSFLLAVVAVFLVLLIADVDANATFC